MELNKRSYGLDFVKIMATIGIFFHHYQQMFDVVFSNHINFFNGMIYWGYLVELFFIISGYLMVRYVPAIINGEIKLDQWIGMRIRRILPMMAVTVVVHEVLHLLYRYINGAPYLGFPRQITLWRTFISALGLQMGGVFSNTQANNPLWYLSVLIICYVVFYLSCSLSQRLRCKPYYLFVFMVFVGLGTIEYCIILPFLNADVARGYVAFFTGTLLALYVKTYGISKSECAVSVIILLVVSALLAIKPDFVLPSFSYVLTFLVFPSIVLLAESPVAGKVFRHKFWAKWSAVSFNVYVWHDLFFVVVYLVELVAGISFDCGKIINMYLLLLTVQVFACFSYKYIEKPLDHMVGNVMGKLKAREKV